MIQAAITFAIISGTSAQWAVCDRPAGPIFMDDGEMTNMVNCNTVAYPPPYNRSVVAADWAMYWRIDPPRPPLPMVPLWREPEANTPWMERELPEGFKPDGRGGWLGRLLNWLERLLHLY